MKLPEFLGGGRPDATLAAAQFRFRRAVGKNEYAVQALESYKKVRAHLVTAEQIAGTPLRSNRFDRLSDLAESQPSLHSPTISQSAIANKRLRALNSGEPIEHLDYLRLVLAGVNDSELQAAAAMAFSELELAQVAETGEPVFEDLTLHAVQRDRALYHRAKLTPVMLRMRYDKQLAESDLAYIRKLYEGDQEIFASSGDLFKGLILLDPFYGPLLGCLAPGVWGFAAYRSFGPIIVSFGRPLAGTRGDAAELLQMLSSESRSSAVDFDELPKGACTAAIEWWTARLDDLLSTMTDPVNFTEKSKTGRFVPEKHLEKLLNIEQIFRRVHAIQTNYRDHNARKTLLFTTLDTMGIATLSAKPEDLCKLSVARKALSELEDSVPREAAVVLLPAARRAVQALENLQDGFFLPRQLGKSTVTIPYTSRAIQEDSFELAAAKYLTVLRNATHGHGGTDLEQEQRSNAMLAQHNGDVPYDLPDLAYLYLLTVLNRPREVQLNMFYRSQY